MEKSTFTREYRVFLDTLKEFRHRAKLSQIQLAAKLDQSQSFVSKCERGETRMDIIQLRVYCRAFGISLAAFVAAFEDRLRRK
jgi:transcriptional regulator with XRE-family HTH domain